MIVVPDAFAQATVEREGDAGRRWIAALPALVAALCAQWDLGVDGAPMHGYLSLVVPVRRGDEPAVLKIAWDNETTREEGAALAAWDGRGAVLLLAANPAQGALLLERLDAGRSLETVDLAEAEVIAGGLLRRL